MSARAARIAVVCLMFLTASAAAAVAQTAEWPRERPPRPLPANDVDFPPYHLQTLPNGMQVIAVLHHEQPVVSMRMIVRAGGALDPADKLGLASLAASLLTQGAGDQTASEMNDAIDFIGGAMGAGAGNDLTFLNMIVMKDSFELGLRMLADMARRPTFAPEEIDRQRQQMLSSLKVSFEDPGFIADAVFSRLVYGFHPYGLPQSGTPETIAAISRSDLVAYHQRHFAPNNAILAIVGDVTVEEAFAGVGKAFGDWERREVPAPDRLDPPQPTRRVVVVNKPDAVQTEIRVGHVGVPRTSDDYMALNLATRILGGEGANRLHQKLRTERGLTYGAQADMHALKDAGDFEASTNTRSQATVEALRLMVDEFWRLQRERVSERELGDAKAYLTGSFPLTIETPDAIATQVLNVVFYGLPVEQIETFRDRVNAVTVDDIQRVARFYFHPDRLSIVLVGDASSFAAQLRGVGFPTFETVEMSNLDLTAADFKRAAPAGRVPAPQGAVLAPLDGPLAYQRTQGIVARPGEEAGELLKRVIAAKGGLERLRSIKSIKAVTRADMATRRGTVEARTTTWLVYPDNVRVETELPEGTVVQVFDGDRAWVRDPAGVHEIPRQAVRELEAGLRRDTISVLLAAHDGEVQARRLPDVKGESGELYHALELSSALLEPMVIYVDPETHLVAKQTYVAGGVGQPLVEELFSDYRQVDGVQIAFSARVHRGGQPMLERRVTDISINPDVDADLFDRPGA